MSQTTAPKNTATLQVNAGATVGPVSLGYYPSEGSKVCSTQYNFSVLTNFYEDLQGLKAFGVETTIQGMWIDNSGNGQPVTITIAGSNQQIIVPAYYQGIFPTFFSDNAAFYISVLAVGGVCKVCLLNVPCNTAGVWPALGNASALNGSGVPIQPLLGTQSFNYVSAGTVNLIPSVVGKRFFITDMTVSIPNSATWTGNGIITLSMFDGSNEFFGTALNVPSVASTNIGNQILANLSNLDYISTAQNQGIICYLSNGLTTGNIYYSFYGGYTTQTP